jgi:hypothetical protein
LIVSALVLSDCQFAQVDVTSCVLPFVRMPIAVACAVAPACVNEERSAEKEKTIVWTVDAAGTVAGGAVGEDEPHAAANRLTASRTIRRRFIVSSQWGQFSDLQWLVLRLASVHKRSGKRGPWRLRVTSTLTKANRACSILGSAYFLPDVRVRGFELRTRLDGGRRLCAATCVPFFFV